MDSVKLQELIDDPKNVFMIVSKVVEKNGLVSNETEATFQKVMAVINDCNRPIVDPNRFLLAVEISSELTIKGSPLFVLEATNSRKGNPYWIDSANPELLTSSLKTVIFQSNAMLVIKEGGVHLVRSKAYPTNIRVEI